MEHTEPLNSMHTGALRSDSEPRTAVSPGLGQTAAHAARSRLCYNGDIPDSVLNAVALLLVSLSLLLRSILAKSLTLEELSANFHLPINDVARKVRRNFNRATLSPPNVMSRGTRNHRLTRLPSLPLDPARAVRHRPEAAMPRTRHHALAVPQGASRPQNTPGPSVAAKRPRYPPSAANGNFFSLGCRLLAADARVPPDPIRSGEETR